MALVALGVTGGIGAYKAAEVCRGLQRAGHDVVVVMTRSAQRFIAPLTFEALTGRPVITSQWTAGGRGAIEHIAVADTIDLLLVAPCTANVIGRFAQGLADDFLTTLYLATRAPVLIAPAMNVHMLGHAAVQANLATLQQRGVGLVEPGEGYLACGWIGRGRLAEPEAIVAAACGVLDARTSAGRPGAEPAGMPGPAGEASTLRGRRVLVTAGPTLEDIDPVRFVGNRSSGKMGYALAAAAAARGARVVLISGPTALTPPAEVQVVWVRSAAQMHRAVMETAPGVDVVVMAAAVADYTPAHPAPAKVAKTDGPLHLVLERTRDILADVGALPERVASGLPVLVGFAAETGEPLARAREKRVRKGADLIVANDVSRPGTGFDADDNEVTLVFESEEQFVSLRPKAAVAAVVCEAIECLLVGRRAAGAGERR
ncbi:MAG: bifunctional phosphopantothenoylcysteine decarboxylase/phosphopantothenate synthase [Vicinamibacterales bacterium]